MYCIHTENLTHCFNGNETVISNINLKVPNGAIYGFLGPNGAGKTTTLRLLLGLLKKQQGKIQIFDKSFETNRIAILRKTGSLIEAPSLYAHLSAKKNLEILQKIYQCPSSRINDVLKIVGLENTGNKSTGKFSLGMKQRLSIAIALMHEPELLILDEPTNGLDPNGIIEMRELLKDLNKRLGMTIMISSHLLAEIEKIVTHIGIIHKGNLIFQGTKNELHEAQQQSAYINLEVDDIPMANTVLIEQQIHPVINENGIQLPIIDREKVAALNLLLVNKGIKVYQIKRVTNDLESIFIDLVK